MAYLFIIREILLRKSVKVGYQMTLNDERLDRLLLSQTSDLSSTIKQDTQ